MAEPVPLGEPVAVSYGNPGLEVPQLGRSGADYRCERPHRYLIN